MMGGKDCRFGIQKRGGLEVGFNWFSSIIERTWKKQRIGKALI